MTTFEPQTPSQLIPFTRGIATPKGATIPVAGPWITQLEVDRVVSAAMTAWYEGAGSFVKELENAFTAYTGRKYAIALPTCSAGLHLSLLGLNIGPGDEVIVPDNTWIASAAFIHHVGATTVFADIDPDTWVLSLDTIKAVVTPRTKAIIMVELYGSMPDWDKIEAFCAQQGIAIIEDAAESIGSKYKNRVAGSFGTTSVFSFHGAKTMTTGEGGIVVTDNSALYERMEFLRDHGRMPGDRTFRHAEIAWKYRMTDLQAALGVVQLERINELVAQKRAIFNGYRSGLADIPGISLNFEPENVYNSFWMSTIVLDESHGIDKIELENQLKDQGIASRPFFYPLSELPAYKHHPQANTAATDRPVSHYLGRYGLNLPSAMCLEPEHIEYVCTKVQSILGY